MNQIKNLRRLTRAIVGPRKFHISANKFNILQCSPNAQLEKNISDRFMCLPIPEPKIQISYVWIDGTGIDLRMKTRTLNHVPSTYKDCPNWSFDGSSTSFSGPEKSDFYIVPIAMYPDPFRRGNNKVVLCETFSPEKKPTKTNHRQSCIEMLNKVCDHEVQFGFEQKYYLIGPDGRPFGYPCGGTVDNEGKGYCGIGAKRAIGRDISECIYRCSLYSGVEIYAAKPEKGYSQWEVVTGPTLSIKAGDDLWMLRYIICRVVEEYGLSASFKPSEHTRKSALHIAMSTKSTRQDGGLKCIHDFLKKMEKNHSNDIKHYDLSGGNDVKKKLTGQHGHPPLDKFKHGVGDRTAHVKISPVVADKKTGFFEDRRPCANADPYVVITTLIKTCLL
ncbi:glutamine synthetase-like [Rhynchophorus ferrugineus]|uniref:glutamine synthetase-like n=1 Tax=Rhynchophorus ferrugineus TaxID=354439 RepID=UPI003FCC535C